MAERRMGVVSSVPSYFFRSSSVYGSSFGGAKSTRGGDMTVSESMDAGVDINCVSSRLRRQLVAKKSGSISFSSL